MMANSYLEWEAKVPERIKKERSGAFWGIEKLFTCTNLYGKIQILGLQTHEPRD